MEALIVVNWKYSSNDHADLVYPEKDGELMETLLKEGGYQNTVLVQNEEDIKRVVKHFVEKQENPLERFHFHYSGYRNSKIRLKAQYKLFKATVHTMVPYAWTSTTIPGNLMMMSLRLSMLPIQTLCPMVTV